MDSWLSWSAWGAMWAILFIASQVAPSWPLELLIIVAFVVQEWVILSSRRSRVGDTLAVSAAPSSRAERDGVPAHTEAGRKA